MELPYDPAIPVLGIYPKKAETLIQKNMLISQIPLCWLHYFNTPYLEAAQMPISRWVDKTAWYIYTMEYYSAVKKEENFTLCDSGIDLDSSMLSEMSQSDRDKYRMISLICGI